MKKTIVITLCFFVFLATVSAQDATALRKKHYNLEGGVALDGYDAVAYILQKKAIKGSKDQAVFYQGVTYFFSSVANKEEFKKNPSRYEPEYGGWCAYAMGEKGEKVSVDPQTFKIIDGKLYLFYNKFFNNTLTDWNKDEVNLKKKADGNWGRTFK